ncbi:MAG: hypothetical protein VX919_00620, partial [Candidatus Thermoplasmatota archaeon]|nr:hypothetical protein [Candidatus Thermoplasmatota archaeon]
TSERILELKGSSAEPLIVGHVSHDGPNMSAAQKQAAMISNRPDELRLVQQPERLIYEASAPIGTITYGGQDGDQRNALRLVGLPSEFELVLGSEVGYVASTPIQSVEIQSSNATVPLTMDGDHVRFSVDGDETSFSVQISDVLRMRRLSPLEEGALGPEGNSRVEMQRTSSAPLRLLFEDTTAYDDPLLGLNGRAVIEPLPAEIEVAVPGGVDSDGLELPDFGDQEGVEGLSFFLGDLVAFGRVANDFIHALTKDLGGSVSTESDLAIGMDLETGEAFNLTADMRKGTTPPEPSWVHGISVEADERVDVALNLSRLERLTLSGRVTLETAWEDARLTADEQEQGALVLESAGMVGARDLMTVLADGRLSEDEKATYDLDNWSEQGIDLTERRGWHVRTWLPSLPAGAIDLDYDFRMVEGVPTYQFDLAFTSWQPLYEDMTVLVKGISGQDVDLRLTGFDTQNAHDVLLDAVFFQERNLTVPRLTLDMRYDVGVPLDSAHAVFIDHTTQTRSEALILGVPRSTDVSATIGDKLILNVTDPKDYQTDGRSSEALMI